MKKYISLALATAAAIACSKVAPEDISPIESLPQDENTENIQGEPSGEKIIISLAQTKVSLDGDGCYQFDGDEVIYVKARSTEAVAKLQNSADEKNTFTGVFNRLLGKDSETFDFYYNCTDENANVVTDEKGNVVKVQNGQPWLAAIGVGGERSKSSEYSYELSDVKLNQLEGYVCLALNSDYPCTVDFHTLSTALPNGETTISGIQLGSGKPYFVNITNGMKGGFYLTVTNPEGQKMYTSYGTTAEITSNKIIKTTKETFEEFSGVTNLEITGFETTYSYYTDNSPATDPNSKKYSWMNEGKVTFNLRGISSSLVNLTFNNGDHDVTVKPVKSGDLFTYTFVSTEDHTTFGEKTLKATVSFKDGIEPGATKETTAVRHITGLPNTLAPSKEYWRDVRNSGYLSYETGYIKMNGSSTSQTPLIESIHFHIPSTSLNVSMIGNFYITSYKGLSKYYSIIYSYIGGTRAYEYKKDSNGGIEMKNISMTGSLTSSKPYVEYETKNANVWNANAYCQIYSTEVKYN